MTTWQLLGVLIYAGIQGTPGTLMAAMIRTALAQGFGVEIVKRRA